MQNVIINVEFYIVLTDFKDISSSSIILIKWELAKTYWMLWMS